jgi:hypothetical protein
MVASKLIRTDAMPKTTISFNVPPKLWSAFKTQTDSLFLSRAPFLDDMVRRELRELRSELRGLRLSLRAKRHIAGAMKRTGPVSVNIEVRPETAEALREATHEHNLVRDAFMSRLVVFLRSTDAFLKLLGLPLVATSAGTAANLEEMPSSPLGAMEAVRDDPLFYIRHHVEAHYKTGIYQLRLPQELDWAACYLPDEEIPGTAAQRRQQKKHDALLAMVSDDVPPRHAHKARGARK